MRITANEIRQFSAWLTAGEKSAATIEKYTREALRFSQWLAGREPGRALARAYKETLVRSPAGGATGPWPPSTVCSPSWDCRSVG